MKHAVNPATSMNDGRFGSGRLYLKRRGSKYSCLYIEVEAVFFNWDDVSPRASLCPESVP